MMDQLKTDYHITFNTDTGVRVLEDILSFCHVFEAPSTQIMDSNVIAFMNGRRDAAMFMLERLDIKNSDLVLSLLNTQGKLDV